MCLLHSIFSKKNKEKGFSLIEILTVIGLAGFTSLLTGAFLAQILGGFNFARFSMDEQKLYADLAKTIGDPASCKGNLKPKASNLPATTATNREGLYGINYQKGIGELEELYVFNIPTQKTGTPVIKIGDFGTNLKIIKMSLEDTDNSPHKPTSANNQDPTKLEDRVFKVYYNHRRGRQKKSDSTCKSAIFTIDSNGNKTISTPAVTTDCYSMECDLRPYETDNQATPNVNKCEADCQLITRPSGGGGGGTVDCYNVKEGKVGTFVGCGTTKDNTNTATASRDANTAFGFNAGNSGSTGIRNIFIGPDTGTSNTTGGKNIFIGKSAGRNNTIGEGNTFIGSNAGIGNTTGTKNIFIGLGVGVSDPSTGKYVTGNENVAIGNEAGTSLTTGTKNVFIGLEAGKDSTTASDNTFIGANAGKAIGVGSGEQGQHNTFIGANAGEKTTASYNNFVGKNAGAKNTTGTRNAFFGDNAGANQVTCNNTEVPWAGGNKYCQNTFFGHYAGNKTNGGFRNVYFGAGTGRDATTAKENTFMGANAGKHTTGSGNTFFGSGAGHGSSEETKTTTAITTGSNNIFIGKEAGLAGKGGVSKTGDYQLNIGNLIFGRMPSSAPTGAAKDFFGNKYLKDGTKDDPDDSTKKIPKEDGVIINGNLYVEGLIFKKCGTAGGCERALTSSRVYKKNITPFVDFNKALTDITTTPLFTYEYKKDHPEHQRMGIIAEDLPPHLQIKDQYEPVKPDWVSIYGTFWASIKALFNKVTNLTKSILRLNGITSSLKVNLYEVKEKLEDLHGVKDRLEVLEKETQLLKNKNNWLTKQNKILKKKIKSQEKKVKALSKKMEVSQ